MFLNSIVKMMQTFQSHKSAHGIEYVKTMIKAADGGANEAVDADKKTNHSTNLLKVIMKASEGFLIFIFYFFPF